MATSSIDEVPLPTLDLLKAVVPHNVEAPSVAQEWFTIFSSYLESPNVSRLCDDCLIPTAIWRDLLALTWDFRILRNSAGKISPFLESQLAIFKPQGFKLQERSINFQQPYPDLVFVSFMFNFHTAVGACSGVARLVPTQSGTWKAAAVLTNLEELHGHPEKVGHLRNFKPNHGLWEQERATEVEFLDRNPQVVIIGAGHCGLIMAARLLALGVSVLVVEKNARVGDNWRNRYDALCLNSPVWCDQMPYMPFPSTWPVLTPARKLASWLEIYAEALELPVWTSTTINSATQSDDDKWHIHVTRQDGTQRELLTNHLIFATGFGGGAFQGFDYPGLKDEFKGQYMHSTQYKSALDHVGKKVVVVGSGTSAHDIAKDCCEHDIDVTMVQRGPTYVMSAKRGLEFVYKPFYWENGPPVDIADRLLAAFPMTAAVEFIRRRVKQLAELDKDTLDGLRHVGFKWYEGEFGGGTILSALTRGGGNYVDFGASQLIIDKKIKLKNDSTISEITEAGLRFADKSTIDVDVIIFATGPADARGIIRAICGDAVANKTKPLWNLDAEGEVNGTWRDTGVKNMWYAFTNLAMCRFHSKHLALQIKAIEEGIFGERYSLEAR